MRRIHPVPRRRNGRGFSSFAAALAAALFLAAPVPADDAPSDPSVTPAEAAGYTCSPTWPEAASYLGSLGPLLPDLQLRQLGATAQGRRIMELQIRSGSAVDDEKNGVVRPVVIITACIHAGEVCGKDAILALVRDLALGREPEILDKLHLILVPVFNLDGHERVSRHNRFTQVGPECGAGTRRNGERLDMNRDFAKLETDEVQALVRQGTMAEPHLFIDLHTDDGIGHQYDLMFGAAVNPTLPGRRGELVSNELAPRLLESIEADGFLVGPLVYPVDRADLSKGLEAHRVLARYSTGYFDYLGTISILSEANPYVSYERRVKATTSLLRAALRFAAEHSEELVSVVGQAREETRLMAMDPGSREIALACEADTTRPTMVSFLGKSFEIMKSAVTGEEYAVYGDENQTYEVPVYGELEASVSATVPAGYFIDKGYASVTRNLAMHGVKFQLLTRPFPADVEAFHVSSVRFSDRPVQGHHPMVSLEGDFVPEHVTFNEGTVWVPADQPAGALAMVLLEPRSPDGFFHWNSFDPVIEESIVLERWALEENARKMLADPVVRAEYERALEDSVFAADADRKLLFFFEKTAYADSAWNVAPVYRYLGVPPEDLGRIGR